MAVLTQIGAQVAEEPRETEFDSCFKEYRLRVFHFALQLVGNREDAMDVTQEAFLKAHRNWSRRDSSRPFGPWIYAIVRNQAIDFLRKKATYRENTTNSPSRPLRRPGRTRWRRKGSCRRRSGRQSTSSARTFERL